MKVNPVLFYVRQTVYRGFRKLRLTHIILLLVAVFLAWDLYPYVHWSRSKGRVNKVVGRTWPEVELELRNAGLKGEVVQAFGKMLEVSSARQSLMARACYKLAVWYGSDEVWLFILTLPLIPSVLVELDTSYTLIRVLDEK